MIVYVDGNDLLDAFRDTGSDVFVPHDRTKGRLNLARWLARYAERQECDVELVFDATAIGEVLPPVAHHGRVRVVNLEPGAESRHAIAGPANRAAQNGRVYVVTSDPRLAQSLSHGNARVFDAEHFLSRVRRVMRGGDKEGLDEPDEKFSGLSEEEVGFWARYFGEDEG